MGRNEIEVQMQLTESKWSKDFTACVECGTTDRPYTGRGMCKPCYQRVWKRELQFKASERVYREGDDWKAFSRQVVVHDNGWKHRAQYDKKIGLTAFQSLANWPFDRKPTETEWERLAK